jgi:membrane protein YqaA with SNARE-associated domain
MPAACGVVASRGAGPAVGRPAAFGLAFAAPRAGVARPSGGRASADSPAGAAVAPALEIPAPMDPSFAAPGLWGMFASSFLSATLLPGNSELVFVALVHQAPELGGAALAVATLGNTLGGMTSYLVGRLLPQPREGRAVAWLARYGPAALLLSWVPVIGDGLCVASGWLRQNAAAATLFVAAGKCARYWVLKQGLALLST